MRGWGGGPPAFFLDNENGIMDRKRRKSAPWDRGCTIIFKHFANQVSNCDSTFCRFAEWVLKMSRFGFPRSPIQVKEAVKLYLDKSGIKIKQFTDNRPGKTWFYGFLRRHLEIKMSRAEKLEQSRAMGCTQESVYAWFDEFEAFYKKFNITSADQVYNCDESGFPLQTASSMKVCVIGQSDETSK